MLKIRLKRLGAKKNPTYRIIVINSTTKREGRPIQELGHYNPKTKLMKLDKATALDWISKGAQPTETVAYLIKNCNEDGSLNYVKKETVKLSKKALAKKHNVPFVINHVGGMFGIFFTDQKQVTSYAEVMKCDTEKFKVFFHKMLDQGVYLAPSAFEAGFMSLAHTNEDIEKTLAAADIAFAAVA